jgi:hypothetical protein
VTVRERVARSQIGWPSQACGRVRASGFVRRLARAGSRSTCIQSVLWTGRDMIHVLGGRRGVTGHSGVWFPSRKIDGNCCNLKLQQFQIDLIYMPKSWFNTG